MSANFDGGNLDWILDGGSFDSISTYPDTATEGFLDWSFDLTVVDTPRAFQPSSTGFAQILDKIFIRETSNVIKPDKQVYVNFRDVVKPEDYYLTFSGLSENSGIATVKQWGKITSISNGTGFLSASSPSYTQTMSLSLVDTSGRVDTIVDYAPDSLGYNWRHQIYDRAIPWVGAAGAVWNAFPTLDPLITGYARDPNFYLNIDLTFTSPGNYPHSYQRAGSLITPKHAVFALHFPATTGMVLHFVSMDNQIVTRTVTGAWPPPYTIGPNDIQIAALDSPVPTGATGINFAKVFPADLYRYFPSPSDGQGVYGKNSLPVYAVGFGQVRIGQIYSLVGDATNGFVAFSPNYFTDPLKSFNVGGPVHSDSGGPLFCVINNEVVLLWCWLSYITGPNLHLNIPYLNSLIQMFDPSYSVTTIDLSAFSTYS